MQPKILLALRLYDILWRLCIPLLKLNSRLKEGFSSRRSGNGLQPADIWIQAASAGEAYLALSLIENMNPVTPVHILVTTNTRQGLDIINKEIESKSLNDQVTAECAYIPFDRPAIMDNVVQRICPKLMILLETEIWPGLLFALKKKNVRTIIINGRLTPKSLQRYLLWPSLWKTLSPDWVLAISDDDARRFATLFGQKKVQKMPNIKFDRLQTVINDTDNHLKAFIPDATDFLVLGSVRQPEEKQIESIIQNIQSNLPETIFGLFPRHMHRIKYWEYTLNRLNVRWIRRSELNREPVAEGTIILWDTFGELNPAYALAKAVFVGGSLVPLGGQNFLEPMIYGIKPIIGPSWENFAWVGDDIFNQGLAIKANDWQSVASGLKRQLRQTRSAARQQAAAIRYIKARKGGTRQACNFIADLLTTDSDLIKVKDHD
ncbi:MAG: 3-deoxy-D-manno-octulosonic acid transferase [Desulfobacteraceae bacterium]|nr:3-deoxy-D-manno-octulosonic acid transferase [Desulfobacteraceae bacterium]MBC2755299.1 3-deoxy-D-manno-octulosonic acid transferase [Desulfobacteraceae bacterium]